MKLSHTVLRLAGRAMAQLAIERSISAQLVFHLAAVARGIVDDIEVALLVNLVRRPLLPVGHVLLLLVLSRHGFAVRSLSQREGLRRRCLADGEDGALSSVYWKAAGSELGEDTCRRSEE